MSRRKTKIGTIYAYENENSKLGIMEVGIFLGYTNTGAYYMYQLGEMEYYIDNNGKFTPINFSGIKSFDDIRYYGEQNIKEFYRDNIEIVYKRPRHKIVDTGINIENRKNKKLMLGVDIGEWKNSRKSFDINRQPRAIDANNPEIGRIYISALRNIIGTLAERDQICYVYIGRLYGKHAYLELRELGYVLALSESNTKLGVTLDSIMSSGSARTVFDKGSLVYPRIVLNKKGLYKPEYWTRINGIRVDLSRGKILKV